MSRLVTVKLTEDKEILEVLRLNGSLRQWAGTKAKPTGPETYKGMMDGVQYTFEHRKTYDLPERIAKGLIQQGVMAGGTKKQTAWGTSYVSAMDSDFVPVLEMVEAWELGQERPSARKARKTVCSICNEDQGTIEALKEHIINCEVEESVEAEG